MVLGIGRPLSVQSLSIESRSDLFRVGWAVKGFNFCGKPISSTCGLEVVLAGDASNLQLVTVSGG